MRLRFSSFRPLRHKPFALLWSANLVSNIGTWMQTVAVGALVTERTGRASWTALVAVAAFLPIGVLAPVGGALADKLERRRWLAVGNLVEAGLATVLAVLSATGRASAGAVTLVVLLNGCVAALVLPFQQALVPDLVERDDVLAASSLGLTTYNMGRVVGPALAGLVIAVSSFTWAFVVNAVSFFAVVAALAAIRLQTRPVDGEGLGLGARIRAGARAARAEPGCRGAIILIALAAFLVAPFIALIPAKASLVSGGGARATAAATGAMTTAQGVGAVVGALLLAPLATRFGRRRMLVSYLLGTPAALCLYAATSSVVPAVAALVAVGGIYVGILAGLSTVVQLRAPAEYRARVLSLFFVALGTIYPVGTLVQGWLADRIGLAETTVVGALALAGAVAAIGLARPTMLAALDDPPAADPGVAPVVDQVAGAEVAAPGATTRRNGGRA